MPACDVLNQFPVLFLEQLATEAVRYLHANAGVVQAVEYQRNLKAEHVKLSVAECQYAINAMLYLMSGVIKAKLSPKNFARGLVMYTGLNPPAVEVIAKVWSEQGEAMLTPEAQKDLHIGELRSLEWKLGVTVASSSCSALNSPFVSMVARVADPDGRIASRAFELTVSEFLEMAQQFEDMSDLMSAL